jgi:hypothetical protein
MRVLGTVEGRIVDRPAGGGNYEVLLYAALRSPQSYTGPTRAIQASVSGAGAMAHAARVDVVDSLNIVAPLDSVSALGTGPVRLLGGELRLQTVKTMPLRLDAGRLHVLRGASNISLSATGTFPPPPEMELTVDSISREPGATVLTSITSLQGKAMKSDIAPALSGGGGGATATERGILPYATEFFSRLDFPPPPTGRSFLTYDTGPDPTDPSDDVGLRPLDLGTEYATSIGAGSSAHNVRLAASQVVSTDARINSLVIPRGNAVTLDNASLTVSSGGIILGGSTSQQTGPMTVVGGSGALNVPGEAVVHADILSIGPNRYVFDAPIRAESLTVSGGGSVALSRTNTFPNGTWINEGYLIAAAPGALGSGPIRLRDADLHFEGGSHTYDAPFVLDRVIDPLDRTFGYQSVVGVHAGDVVTLNGPVSGAGLMRTKGPGTLRFNGDADFQNLSFVIGGTVEINGTWRANLPGGLSAIFFENNPTLAGTGTFLGEVGFGGTVAPGRAGDAAPATFTVDRMRGSGVLAIDIDAQQNDQLAVLTSLNLTGRSLDVNVVADPALGDEFRIVDNRFAGAITGTFTGLAEGSVFFDDGWNFQITYLGGDGNDVALTAVVPEPTAALVTLLALGATATRPRHTWRRRHRQRE